MTHSLNYVITGGDEPHTEGYPFRGAGGVGEVGATILNFGPDVAEEVPGDTPVADAAPGDPGDGPAYG